MFNQLGNYKYYNAPDGQRPFEKIIATSKYGFFLSMGFGSYECRMNPAVDSFRKGVNCMAWYMIPMTTVCATFSAVTYMSTNIRGKDDPMNYAIGSLVSGGVIYKWLGRPIPSLYYTLLGMLTTSIYKYSKQINYELFPLTLEWMPVQGSFFDDYTLLKDPRPWKN